MVAAYVVKILLQEDFKNLTLSYLKLANIPQLQDSSLVCQTTWGS